MKLQVVFFDGVCSLCNRIIDFLIRMQKGVPVIKVASLQSPAAQKLLGAKVFELNSVLFWQEGKITEGAEAAFAILKALPIPRFSPWRGLLFFQVFPQAIQKWVYHFISQNRYAWFGKRATCRIPTEADKKFFYE